ncbi:MAG: alpha-N-arabinofuranosidase [Candidatus Sulfotelmatobacter sp.]
MFSSKRRKFLKQAATAGIACSANSVLRPIALAQSSVNSADVCRIYVDSRRTIAALDRNLFGSFLEHLGRAIYEGIYDPGSKLSDSAGFRKDVIEEVRRLGVPIIRYPGGNFVSGYNWLDGVGPKKDRPRVLDKAWNTIDTNQFGTDEFMAWCKLVGSQPLMGLNLGTGTAEQAAALVEYCNVEKGTKWSDLRRAHGIEQPYNVEHWCLGNEMDGPWQIGHMTAEEYGLKAQDAARQMRAVDPSLKLVACGSSGPAMPTYLEWDREVLEQCYEYVDALSLHRYVGNTREETGGDSTKFLAMNLSLEQQIAETLAVCDLVRGHKRSPKRVWLSFDEWNVWYRARTGDAVNGHEQVAPHLLEEVYNLEDALVVGGILNSLIRNADRVKIACLAQLVNVIAPLVTDANGVLRQTIYYPYSWALQMARGNVLDLLVQSPTYEVSEMGQVPYLDVAATLSSGDGKVSMFILNRDLDKPHSIEINWQDWAPNKGLSSNVLTGGDLKAFNTFDAPKRIVPQPADKPSISRGRSQLELPARSYTVIEWAA